MKIIALLEGYQRFFFCSMDLSVELGANDTIYDVCGDSVLTDFGFLYVAHGLSIDRNTANG